MEKLKIKKTARTKIFLGKKHVKTIPEKYADVFKKKHIINSLKKRLTREERFRLEVSLFELNLKRDHPFAYNLIKRSIPDYVRKVTTVHSGNYYELVYKNKMAAKVGVNIYKLCQDQREIKRNY